MKETKTRKLTCLVTGRTLFAGKDYYNKKVQKAGSEQILHDTYICREAKQLLTKGHKVDYVQDLLNTDKQFKCRLSDGELTEIVSGDDSKLKFRLNNYDNKQTGVIKTDPDVKQLIQNILNDRT
jgi:hypothetical protein